MDSITLPATSDTELFVLVAPGTTLDLAAMYRTASVLEATGQIPTSDPAGLLASGLSLTGIIEWLAGVLDAGPSRKSFLTRTFPEGLELEFFASEEDTPQISDAALGAVRTLLSVPALAEVSGVLELRSAELAPSPGSSEAAAAAPAPPRSWPCVVCASSPFGFDILEELGIARGSCPVCNGSTKLAYDPLPLTGVLAEFTDFSDFS